MEAEKKESVEKERGKTFTRVVVGLGIVVVALVIFQAGIFVGYRRAAFSYGWGERYYDTFVGRGGPMGMPAFDRELNSNGTVGKIVTMSLPTIFISGTDNAERQVVLTDDTQIRRFRDALIPKDLSVGELVVVIGEPNQKGQIEATLIRVLPPPPTASSTLPSGH